MNAIGQYGKHIPLPQPALSALHCTVNELPASLWISQAHPQALELAVIMTKLTDYKKREASASQRELYRPLSDEPQEFISMFIKSQKRKSWVV